MAVTDDLSRVCEDAARAAGSVLLDWASRFSVREKGPADLVTEADIAAQEVIQQRILKKFPNHGFLGEESTGDINPGAPYRWIVDPLDGTTNYVHQVPYYCVSIALQHEDELILGTIFDPVANHCYTGTLGHGAFLNGTQRLKTRDTKNLGDAMISTSLSARSPMKSAEMKAFSAIVSRSQAVRRMGSAALNLCQVAAGHFDAYWAENNKIWDVAAGFVIVQEAGGYIAAVDGGKIDLKQPKFIATATAELHAEMRELLNADNQ